MVEIRKGNKANFSGMAKGLSNKELINQIKTINEKKPSSYWYNKGDKKEFEEELRKRKLKGKIRQNAGIGKAKAMDIESQLMRIG
jgi:hypothetical protein